MPKKKENCCDHPKGGRKLSPPAPLPLRAVWFPKDGDTRSACRGDSKTSLCGGDPALSVSHNLRCRRLCWAFSPSLSLPVPHLCPPFRVWVCCRCGLGDTWQNLCPQLSRSPPLLPAFPSPPRPPAVIAVSHAWRSPEHFPGKISALSRKAVQGLFTGEKRRLIRERAQSIFGKKDIFMLKRF